MRTTSYFIGIYRLIPSSETIASDRTSTSHTIVSVMNLKICGKILPIQLQQRIIQKDSTQVLNLECYAELFCLSTQYGILGGNFPSIDRYTAQFLVQAVHFSYWWDAIVNNFRDHLLEQSNERVVQGLAYIHDVGHSDYALKSAPKGKIG